MSEEYEQDVRECLKGKRKRVNKSQWQKSKTSLKINCSEGKTPSISCTHINTKLCQADELTRLDIEEYFTKLYSNKTAADQNNFLLKFIRTQNPSRHRPRTENPKNRQRNDYFIRKLDNSDVRVCAKTFQSITRMSKFRLISIAAYFLKEGSARPERRGGARMNKSDLETTESINDHIKSLKCRSSHYGRNKSVRSYLPPELSVKKLYRMWCDIRNTMHAPIVSYMKYYKIFTTKFNLGFGHPRTDVCSFCELKKTEIKTAVDNKLKLQIMTELRLHKLRAKKFYALLKQKEVGVVKVCFDMQQNQPLPKLSIGDVYYLRQIWLYNLTIMIHEEHQNKSNIFSYVWTENQSGKGSNEVASALLNFLDRLEQKYDDSSSNTSKLHTLKLYSDSCPGQNKNSTIMLVLLCYIQQSKIFQEIHHIFPIRGHSFMPPDRVFGRTEKIIRKTEIILSPEEYCTIFKTASTVLQNIKHWEVKNYKAVADSSLKSKFAFKTGEQRVFIYTKGSKNVSVKTTYTGDPCTQAVLKNNVRNLSSVLNKVKTSPPINKISVEKKGNVSHLIKHLTLTDEAKVFYKRALKNVGNRVPDEIIEPFNDEDEPFL